MTEPLRAEYEDLRRQGWAIFPPLERDALDALRAVSREFAAMVRAQPTLGGNEVDLEVGLFNTLRIEADDTRRAFQARVDAVLIPWAERAFPEHRPVSMGVVVKLAHVPHEPLPFHRDHAVVDERSHAAALQLWIPLVDVDEDNGALIVINGSHLAAPRIRPIGAAYTGPRTNHHREELPAGAVQPRLPAGAVMVFDNRTRHASTPNRSDEDRPAIAGLLLPRAAQMIEWEDKGDHFELWAMREVDNGLVSRRASRVQLLETVPKAPEISDERQTRGRASDAPPAEENRSEGADVRDELATHLAEGGSLAGFTLTSARAVPGRLVTHWDRHGAETFCLVLEQLAPGQPSFRRIAELGLSYQPSPGRTGRLDRADMALLEAFAAMIERHIQAFRGLSRVVS